MKTFNKSVSRMWGDFTTALPDGKLFAHATVTKISPEAAKACRGVNMLVIGDKLVYPARNRHVKVRETAKGIFIEETRSVYPDGKPIPKAELKKESKATIVLAKDGNHLKYGRELARKNGKRQRMGDRPIMFGTLKTSSLKSRGETYKTFMRDMARLSYTPEGAIIDHRYLQVEEEIERDDYESKDEYLDANAESNGVVALIRVEF